jgi:Fuc2NAc and GlcNAc transferase
MMAGALLTLALAFAASWWGTGLARRFLLTRSVLDIPNPRSSHSTPTPRGGGVAMVAVVLAGILVGVAGGWIRGSIALALVPSGAAVALVSWLDDRRGTPQWVRLLVHVGSAAWVVYCFGPVEALDAGGTLRLGFLGPVVTVLGIAWTANLFNFMDGIDGLAAGEAITVGFAAMLLCWRTGDLEPTWLAALVAVAAAGFLPWNWAPARVFMGDVGSVFLGFIFAALAVLTGQRGDIPATGWLVLLGVFILDATITLLRRIGQGERWFAAHRRHAYQRAVQAGLTHAQVSGTVMVVNGVLALLVWWGVARPNWAGPVYGGALILLLALYWRVGRARPADLT